ncbi:MAG: hypothetical protein DRP63_04205 [Planctomycetota bacterium]|nr:MAG: hypothetical protein DRP63_04205 [Planctomycetota bacterium]
MERRAKRIDSELKAMIEEIVERKLLELLTDPDFGLELREEVKERLRRLLRSRKKGVPLQEVANRLGLKW